MIKIESVKGDCTIVRGEDTCVVFVGMVVFEGELETLKGGEVTYTVDEGELQVAGAVATPAVTPIPEAAKAP